MAFERRYFGTDGIRGRVGTAPITTEFALKLGWAVGQVMMTNEANRAVIGMDTRVSGTLLANALEAGLTAQGAEVLTVGVLPTPGIAYLTQALKAQVGVVISASHNPYYDNGIKFFNAKGHKLTDTQEQQIEASLSQTMQAAKNQSVPAEGVMDAPGRYIQFCQQSFPKDLDLQSLKIVIDCAQGATYHIAPHVFEELGAQVISINISPDGKNINEQCGSTHPEGLQQAVKHHQADVGIAFDGDGDRVLFVDNQGNVVDGDELLFVIANGRYQAGSLQGGVVGTLMSNFGLEQAFKARNIPFLRAKVGDRYVMDTLLDKGWQLGGESSGHLICLDKTTTGDGIIAALQILAQMVKTGKSLAELKRGMNKSAQVLINVPAVNGQAILQRQAIQQIHDECQQLLKGRGRILLRPSGTEPLVRVMVEGDDEGMIQQIANEIAKVVIEEAEETLSRPS